VTTTLEWYNANAKTFAAGAHGVDLGALHAAFMEHLAPAARVLDVGAGSGRDALAFEAAGYEVTALEPSAVLARRVESLIRGAVWKITAEALEAECAFEGVWACASLLHVPRANTEEVMRRVFRALVAGGVFYVSFKRGEGERWEAGRYFADHTVESLGALLNSVGFEHCRLWETPDARPERADTVWVNALAWRSAEVSTTLAAPAR
jgi:SAM-dependent methyltransferase